MSNVWRKTDELTWWTTDGAADLYYNVLKGEWVLEFEGTKTLHDTRDEGMLAYDLLRIEEDLV
jgi:hypothetical protein